MYELSEIGVGREQQDDVIERNGTDEVEKEPRLDVVFSDLARLEDDFVGEIVGDDTCGAATVGIAGASYQLKSITHSARSLGVAVDDYQ